MMDTVSHRDKPLDLVENALTRSSAGVAIVLSVSEATRTTTPVSV